VSVPRDRMANARTANRIFVNLTDLPL